MWEFFPLDDEAFPAVRLAREAGSRGGTARPPTTRRTRCVAAFLAGEMRFTDIVPTIERVLGVDDVLDFEQELTVDDVLAADAWARQEAAASRRRNRRAVVNPR